MDRRPLPGDQGVADRTERIALRALVGTNLRRLRKAEGLSQERLAERAGLHWTYVGSVERGERNVSIDNIGKLAAALAVDVRALFAPASGEVFHPHSRASKGTTRVPSHGAQALRTRLR